MYHFSYFVREIPSNSMPVCTIKKGVSYLVMWIRSFLLLRLARNCRLCRERKRLWLFLGLHAHLLDRASACWVLCVFWKRKALLLLWWTRHGDVLHRFHRGYQLMGRLAKKARREYLRQVRSLAYGSSPLKWDASTQVLALSHRSYAILDTTFSLYSFFSLLTLSYSRNTFLLGWKWIRLLDGQIDWLIEWIRRTEILFSLIFAVSNNFPFLKI